MTRQVLYVAAPLRPTEDEIAVHDPRFTKDEPMAASTHSSGDDDSDPAVRERAMQDNFAVIERCDGIVLCGGRISEGMRREMDWGVERGWCRTIMHNPHVRPHEFYVYSRARG